MKEQNLTPFEEEKPQIVHFEKDDSHYEYCRMQMHDIEKTHRRTFFCNLALCIFVSFLSIFKIYIGGFGVLSTQFAEVDSPGATLAGGIFQILISMGIIIVGYLAWANYHSLNIVLEAWYAAVTLLGICKLDYMTALIGVVGAVFYYFSFREMKKEEALSELDGYPDFAEKLDISKSDIVIQTLLAHKGERRSKSTLFTTDYSLRRMKKKKAEEETKPESDAGAALAESLKKHLDEAKDTQETVAEPAEAVPEAVAETVEAAAETVEEAAPETEIDAEEQAAAILAEAEAKAKALLAEAVAKADQVKGSSQPAKQTDNTPNQNQNRKKKNNKRR